MAQGVDVANWQRGVDWGVARTGGGIEFAYIKSSEGVGYVDPVVDEHLSGARGAGLYTGLYHYARPDTNAPEEDAAHFAAQLLARGAAKPGSLPPCLDMEENAAVNMVSWTQRCIAKLRELTGYGPVMIYANTSWWLNQLGGGGWLDDQMYAWVADYGRDPGFRNDRTVMHQYTSSGRIPGYGADIDVNTCWVDLGVLADGRAPAPAAPPDPRPDGWWTVESGQTLSSIGEQVGIGWHDIAAWNGLSNPDLIHVGQRLRLTPPEGSGGGGTYTVQPGDSLSGIAAAHGTDWQTLYQLNRGLISDPDVIQAGWVLALPGGSAPAPAPQVEWYEVQSGDNLSSIAQDKGVAGGWNAIYQANRDIIADPDVVHVGWKIRIPR